MAATSNKLIGKWARLKPIQLKKSCSWQPKTALVLGLGALLGVVFAANPASADPHGSPYDGDANRDPLGSSDHSGELNQSRESYTSNSFDNDKPSTPKKRSSAPRQSTTPTVKPQAAIPREGPSPLSDTDSLPTMVAGTNSWDQTEPFSPSQLASHLGFEPSVELSLGSGDGWGKVGSVDGSNDLRFARLPVQLPESETKDSRDRSGDPSGAAVDSDHFSLRFGEAWAKLEGAEDRFFNPTKAGYPTLEDRMIVTAYSDRVGTPESTPSLPTLKTQVRVAEQAAAAGTADYEHETLLAEYYEPPVDLVFSDSGDWANAGRVDASEVEDPAAFPARAPEPRAADKRDRVENPFAVDVDSDQFSLGSGEAWAKLEGAEDRFFNPTKAGYPTLEDRMIVTAYSDRVGTPESTPSLPTLDTQVSIAEEAMANGTADLEHESLLAEYSRPPVGLPDESVAQNEQPVAWDAERLKKEFGVLPVGFEKARPELWDTLLAKRSGGKSDFQLEVLSGGRLVGVLADEDGTFIGQLELEVDRSGAGGYEVFRLADDYSPSFQTSHKWDSEGNATEATNFDESDGIFHATYGPNDIETIHLDLEGNLIEWTIETLDGVTTNFNSDGTFKSAESSYIDETGARVVAQLDGNDYRLSSVAVSRPEKDVVVTKSKDAYGIVTSVVSTKTISEGVTEIETTIGDGPPSWRRETVRDKNILVETLDQDKNVIGEDTKPLPS